MDPIGPIPYRLDPPMQPFCTLPHRITSLSVQDGKVIAETEHGLYEILANGSYIGVTF